MEPSTQQHEPAHPPLIGRRVAAVIAAGLCAAGTVAIWGLIAGRIDSTSTRVLGSAVTAAAATLCGLAGSTLLARSGARRSVGTATIAASGTTVALTLAVIWVDAADTTAIYRALAVSVITTLTGTHASLLLHWLRPSDDRTVQRIATAAITASSTAGALGCTLAVLVDQEIASGAWRFLGVLIVAAVLATLLAPLTRRIHSAGKTTTDNTRHSPPYRH